MAVEIHEDQPLVEPGVAWIRQVHIPMITQFDYGGTHQYPPQLAFGQVANGVRILPLDLTSVDQCILAFYPQDTGNYTLNYILYAGSCGELWNVHTDNANVGYPVVDDVIECVDLVAQFPAFFAALVAGDYLRVRVNNQTAARWIVVYGLVLRYS